jgi:hypothetical protein
VCYQDAQHIAVFVKDSQTATWAGVQSTFGGGFAGGGLADGRGGLEQAGDGSEGHRQQRLPVLLRGIGEVGQGEHIVRIGGEAHDGIAGVGLWLLLKQRELLGHRGGWREDAWDQRGGQVFRWDGHG